MNAILRSSAIVALSGSAIAFINMAASAQDVIHVDIENGTVNGDGSSWGSDAFQYLQDALDEAADLSEFGLVEIWVAQGTYRPDQSTANPSGTNDREMSFELTSNVRLYGGFAGHETSLGERNVELNETILSGQIGDPATIDDNTFHVVRAFEVDNTAMLNGFTVRDGNAIGSPGEPDWPFQVGGGLRIRDAAPVFVRCHIRNNTAGFGGGVYYDATLVLDPEPGDGPIFYNCTMSDNVGTRGGAMRAVSGAIIVANSVISNNISKTYGGGIATLGTALRIVNCTFVDNHVLDGEGGTTGATNGGALDVIIFEDGRTYEIRNTILYGNTVANPSESWMDQISFGGGPGQVSDDIVEYSCIEKLDQAFVDPGNNVYPLVTSTSTGENPLYLDPANNNYRLQPASPVIDLGQNSEVVSDLFNVADLPSSQFDPMAPAPDLDLGPRILDGLDDSSSIVDMGAYEFNPLVCPDADLTGDGQVGVFDLLVLLSEWGQCADPADCPADLNGDGTVNVNDLLELLVQYGTMCGDLVGEIAPQTVEDCENRYGDDVDRLISCIEAIEEIEILTD